MTRRGWWKPWLGPWLATRDWWHRPRPVTPPGTSRPAFHRPHAYRYRVADPGLRLALNRYPGAVIGVALVIGRYAYCVKWADAKALHRHRPVTQEKP